MSLDSLIFLACRHRHAAELFLCRRLGGGLGEAKACSHVIVVEGCGGGKRRRGTIARRSVWGRRLSALGAVVVLEGDGGVGEVVVGAHGVSLDVMDA